MFGSDATVNKNLWQTLNGLCKKSRIFHDRVNELYGRINFPYKIRSKFAEWIEEQDWDAVDLDEDSGKRKAENLYKELVMRIDSTEENMQKDQGYDLEKTLDLGRAKDGLRKAFDGNYGTFVDVIRKCLGEERLLIQSCEDDDAELKRKVRVPQIIDHDTLQIQQALTDLNKLIAHVGQQIEDVQQEQGKFQLVYAERDEKIKQLISQLSKGKQPDLERVKVELEREVQRSTQENYNLRKGMTETLMFVTMKLSEVLKSIWEEIRKWNHEQKLEITALSKPVDGSLDKVDKLCNEAGDALVKMVQHLQNALPIFDTIRYQNDPCEGDLKKTLDGILHDILPLHLQHAFVVERNIPDRVLKVSSGKSLGFSMSLRLLGGSGLGLSFAPPKVLMSLFHEKNIPPGMEYMPGMCTILNGQERTFIFNRGNNSCSAQFHSIQLKNVKRPDRGKNEELVTEHKYAFVFFTSVTVCGKTIPIKVVSLPIILTSQTSQEIMAKGTLIWHAAFSDEGKNLFEYKESVPWSAVAKVLHALFVQNTGRGLTSEQLLYLARSAFRHKEPKRQQEVPVSFDNKPISEKQVIRDRLSGRDFSFWKWFYACMNLVIHHVKREWEDGKIYGFISKEDAKRKLKEAPCGTFLLRFSESAIENSQKSDICGYLTVAVMEIDPESGQMKLFHVKDYLSPKEIQEKGLAPILDAMEVVEFTDSTKKKRLLQYLWPDVTKRFEDVFGTYIKHKESSDDGYRRGKYSIEIFLTDEQSRRGRQDSVDGSVCDTGSCPPSVQTVTPINSPIYEWPQDCQASGSYDFNQLLLNMPVQRPLAAVKPNFVPLQQTIQNQSYFDSITDIDLHPFMADGQILGDAQLEAMLIADRDGDLVIPSDVNLETLRYT